MISTHDKTDQQIHAIGLNLLQKELGTTGLLRFLQLFERGQGDYTQTRQAQTQSDTVDSLVAQIKQRRLSQPS